jgi:DNA-directed RNA polymerase subunit N (RpoN/RPB10)
VNIGRNFLQGNIKVMNTGHLTLILPVECFICGKKSLKIPKGQSESVYRRTDNTKQLMTDHQVVARPKCRAPLVEQEQLIVEQEQLILEPGFVP